MKFPIQRRTSLAQGRTQAPGLLMLWAAATLAISLAWSPPSHALVLAPTQVAGFDEAFGAAPKAASSPKTLVLEQVEVQFSERWLKDQRSRLTQSDQARLLARYQTLWAERLRKGLTAQGHRVIEATDPAAGQALRVRAQVRDLVINAPQPSLGISRQFVFQAGHAKVQFEVMGEDQTLMARLVDRRDTANRAGPWPVETNDPLNKRDFGWLFDRWGQQFGDYLARL